MRRRLRTARFLIGTSLLLLAAALIPFDAARSQVEEPMRRRGLEELRLGRPEVARAVFDSLLRADLTDLTAGYLSARAEAEAGRPERARCRWLEVEGVAGNDRIGVLAAARRRWSEQQVADALFAGDGSEAATPGGGDLALLPLESLGAGEDTPYFGLAWTYLLFDALRGAGLCPISVPSMLAVQDRVTRGRAVRVPAELTRRPVNTVNGIRLRLALLPRRDGGTYLAGTMGGWDAELRSAILEFQREEGLAETGEADLVTQDRLESRIDRWIEQPPAPLPPSRLEEFLATVGASLGLRGTYRRDGDRILVEMSIVTASGQSIHVEPIRRSFPEGEVCRAAFEVAEEVSRLAGGSPSAWNRPAPSLGIRELEAATAVLMRIDRGAFFVEPTRWSRLSARVYEWEFVATAREISLAGLAEIDLMEQRVIEDWIGRIRLDPDAAMSGWMDQLGDRLGGGFEGPGAAGVLGQDGRIRIRGSGP